jgi:hypothetical protein
MTRRTSTVRIGHYDTRKLTYSDEYFAEFLEDFDRPAMERELENAFESAVRELVPGAYVWNGDILLDVEDGAKVTAQVDPDAVAEILRDLDYDLIAQRHDRTAKPSEEA